MHTHTHTHTYNSKTANKRNKTVPSHIKKKSKQNDQPNQQPTKIPITQDLFQTSMHKDNPKLKAESKPDWLAQRCSSADALYPHLTLLMQHHLHHKPLQRHGEDPWTVAGTCCLSQSPSPRQRCPPPPQATLPHSAPAGTCRGDRKMAQGLLNQTCNQFRWLN